MTAVPYEFRFRLTDWMAAMCMIPLDRAALFLLMKQQRLTAIAGPDDEAFLRQQLGTFVMASAFAFGAAYLATRLATHRGVTRPWHRAGIIAAGNLLLVAMFLGVPLAMFTFK